MATPVEMPKLGNTVEECILAKWRKKRGDPVSSGEILADIETDKASFELAASASGIVLETFFEQGALIPVFTNICVIGDPGEPFEPFRPKAAAPVEALAEKPPVKTAAPAPRTGQEAVAREGSLSPRAGRFAAEHDFRPERVAGSGPGGRILEQDLKHLYRSQPRQSFLARKLVREGYQAQPAGSGINDMIVARDLGEPPVPMTGIRQRIAQRMWESLAMSAQYTLNSSASATGLLRLREKIKSVHETRAVADVNLNEMVMFAAVKALVEMPQLNAELVDGKICQHSRINLGFASDTPRGLLVPVVKGCEKLSLEELSACVKRLSGQAGAGSLSLDDLEGATFTVSNLGNLGIESFTPILNPPQVALLGVNSIELKPVRMDGKVEFVERIGLSLTCDHQVIDGAPGARFLKLLASLIENIEDVSGLAL